VGVAAATMTRSTVRTPPGLRAAEMATPVEAEMPSPSVSADDDVGVGVSAATEPDPGAVRP